MGEHRIEMEIFIVVCKAVGSGIGLRLCGESLVLIIYQDEFKKHSQYQGALLENKEDKNSQNEGKQIILYH